MAGKECGKSTTLEALERRGVRHIRFVRRELTVDIIDEDTGERLGWWFAGEEETLAELVELLKTKKLRPPACG